MLELRGISCWISPRDIPMGKEYGEAIIAGIENTAATILVLSEQANESIFVRREIERAVSKGKPVFPVRIRNVLPSTGLELFISSFRVYFRDRSSLAPRHTSFSLPKPPVVS